jgi:hypothetical protein
MIRELMLECGVGELHARWARAPEDLHSLPACEFVQLLVGLGVPLQELVAPLQSLKSPTIEDVVAKELHWGLTEITLYNTVCLVDRLVPLAPMYRARYPLEDVACRAYTRLTASADG